ncbi:MAG: DUF11 domain-containing protein, partial [Bacteroidetes bacterium]|nr:DUF11 domain-containing protein [Bacteroidota bacterium]
MNHIVTQLYRRELVLATFVRKLSLVLPIILCSFGLFGQNPVISVRFANPQFDCATGDYCVDVEFNSDTPGQELFGMNVRFFYDEDVLEFNGFGDFQGGYGPFAPNPPEISTSDSAGPALFGFPGSATFVNGAIQLVNTGATPIEIPSGVDNWVKIFQACFAVDDPSIALDQFSPAVIWDQEQDPSNGGFLAGDEGVVITVVNTGSNEGSSPADEMAFHNNWQYTDPDNPPYGEATQENSIVARCIDLALNKSVTTSTPTVGCQVVFSIEVDNSGVDTATNVVVLDLLSDGFSYDSDNSGGNYNNETGEWTIASIAGGSSAVLEITATVTSTGNYTNLAEVISATGIDGDSTPGNGVDTDGDTNVEDDTDDEDDGDGVVVLPETPNMPTADAGQDGLLTCDIDMVTLNGSNSSSENDIVYTWLDSNMNVFGSDILLDVNVPGTYTLIVTDTSSNCSATSTVNVIQNIIPLTADAGVGGILSCNVPSIALDGSNSSQGANFEYNWFNSNNTNVGIGISINISEADTFTLVVTNPDNGCTDSDEVVITQDSTIPTATASSDGDITCIDAEVLLDGTGSSYGTNIQYEWQNAAGTVLSNDISFETDSMGIYRFVVTNTENGCSTSEQIVIDGNITNVTSDAGMAATLTCGTSSTTLDGSNSSSGNNISYEWSNSTGAILGNDVMVEVSFADTFYLIVTNSENGCTDTSFIEVLQDVSVPNPNITSNGELTCTVQEINLDGTGSNGVGAIEFSWTDENDIFISNDSIIQVSSAGNYNLEVIDISNGCTSSSEVEVIQSADVPTAIILSPDLITCSQSVVTLNASNSSGIGTLSFIWKDSMGQMIGIDSMLSVTQSGVYTMDVIDEDNGCAASTSVLVDQNITLPDADAGADGVITCAQDFYTLNAINSSQGSSFQQEWFDGNGMKLGNGLTFDVNQIGVYSLVVTNIVNGCTAESFVEVFENKNAPTALAEASGLLTCTVQEITLDGTGSNGVGAIEFSWTDENGIFISNDSIIQVSSAGNYNLEVIDLNNGCTSSSEVEVIQSTDVPTAIILSPDLITCSQDLVTLNASNSSGIGMLSFIWKDSMGQMIGMDSVLSVTQSGVYTMDVIDEDN